MERSQWTPPVIHQPESEKELQELLHDTKVRQVVDPVLEIADDLFELRNPSKAEDTALRDAFRAEVVEEGPSFGSWVQYPWSDTLVRFPAKQDHYDLRTFRNRNLITKEEQSALQGKKIAAFGLSVGSEVVSTAVQSGIGGEYLLFDYDRLTPTNLNRIRATMAQVGLYKTTIAGQKMAELDPYIEQQHYTEGYTHNTDDILWRERPDLIVEEVDDVAVKAKLRRLAAELEVPLVMAGDVGDTSTLQIERHDLGAVKPFNGRLTNEEYEALLSDDPAVDKDGILMKMVGVRNLTTRLIDSAMERGVELAGLPQLATTVAVGGGLATVAMRDALLGRDISSADRTVNIRKAVGSPSPVTARETVDTLKRFVAYRKVQKRGSSE